MIAVSDPGDHRSRRGQQLRWTRTGGLDALLVAGAVLVVTAPLLFTRSGFAADFTDHLWLTWVAGREFVQGWHPSFFINTAGSGVFYPYFTFYGGTLNTLTGAVAELLGDRPLVTFAGATTLAVIGCYTGMLSLGRQFGLRCWIAHAPALTVVTSAYYITNLYGRGDWAEFVATSAIAPFLAGGVHLVRAPAWRPLPVLAFTVATVIFTGSHDVTLVWGPAMIAVALLVVWLALGAPRRLPYRRLAMVAGLGAVAALVNAWFMFPDIAYEGNLLVSREPGFDWYASSYFNTPAVLLDPLRHVPYQSSTPALFVQAPVWFLVWGLVAGALLLWRGPTAKGLRRAWIGAMIVVILAFGLIVFPPIWGVLPFPLTQLQVPYRLGTYLFYAIAGLVLVSALALQLAPSKDGLIVKTLRSWLVAFSAVSIGLCVWQQWVPRTLLSSSYPNRAEALTSVHILPRTWYDPGVFRDAQAPIVAAPRNRLVIVKPSLVRDNRFSAWMKVPPGREPIQTNIGGGSYIVRISGLERVGRSPGGFAVVRRVDGGSGPVHVVVEVAHSPVIELGWALSGLAILAVLVIVAYTAVRTRSLRIGQSDTRMLNSRSVHP